VAASATHAAVAATVPYHAVARVRGRGRLLGANNIQYILVLVVQNTVVFM
jgi:hypothetical protein